MEPVHLTHADLEELDRWYTEYRQALADAVDAVSDKERFDAWTRAEAAARRMQRIVPPAADPLP